MVMMKSLDIADQLFQELQSILDKNTDLTSSWKLVDENYLSLFSFAKLSMYQDLEINKDEIESHSIIKRISGEESNATTFSLNQNYADVKPENIDDKFKSLESFKFLTLIVVSKQLFIAQEKDRASCFKVLQVQENLKPSQILFLNL